MEAVFGKFREAIITGQGYLLSESLAPVPPSTQPDLLRAFFRSTNYQNVKRDIQYNVLYDTTTSLRLPTEEGNAWVDVYVAYWKAVGEILTVEEAMRTNSKVRWDGGGLH